MTLLKCNNLCVGYGNNIIVSGINLTVNEGDYLSIIGSNGSGKSTLMKTILRLQPPISGEVEWAKNLSIGYLPQQSDVQRDFPASVMEVVMSGFIGKCGHRPFYTKEQKDTAKSFMTKMRIENLAKRNYSELSGGQQQRVLLARAMCASSKVLLLDEPVTGLDPVATQEMYTTIELLNHQGIAIIMISHDIEAATKYSSHIFDINKKEVTVNG